MKGGCAVPAIRRSLFPRPPRLQGCSVGDTACAPCARKPKWAASAAGLNREFHLQSSDSCMQAGKLHSMPSACECTIHEVLCA